MIYYRDQYNVIIPSDQLESADLKWPVESEEIKEPKGTDIYQKNGVPIQLRKISVWNGTKVEVKPDFRDLIFYQKSDFKNTKTFLPSENPNFLEYTLDEPDPNELFQIHSEKGWVTDETRKEDYLKNKIRAFRDHLLLKTDPYLLPDRNLEPSTKDRYIRYRQYLRDYTQKEDWFLSNPSIFSEWQET
ncbi:phage tail assembly chaperone [Leptospira idonii]|uniref:Phage tail assembly chaperone-like domain-containing protein n=1 Tax=Leptospira idonii TaxID=1193500 RepID=A0A4V3JYN6_9LEPT|nr:phage tail assembly chaperone [Leptospira idonii]TGN20816.1 hypothetical protein EHS15_01905 [Leptospira idonii]